MTMELFIAGAVGAIAPEIVRLYEMRSDPQLRFSPFYLFVSVAYVALGGYIATIFPGVEQPFWAACIGAGLVLVVNKMVHIGGLLARGVARTAGEEERPRALEGRRPRPTPRRAGFFDYVAKL